MKEKNMTTIVYEAVDNLNNAFVEFKTKQDERLESMEKNQSHKVNELSDVIIKTAHRLDRLETAFKRPNAEMAAKLQTSASDQNFKNYVRKGIEQGLMEQKSLSSAQDNSGGFLIPQAVTEMINTKLMDHSMMRRLSRVTSISTDTLELLLEKGDASVGWVAETADRGETDTPELAKVRIPVHQIYAKPRVSQKLLDDSFVDVEGWLSNKISENMAGVENAAFIHGDGQGKPRGILTYETCDFGHAEWGKIEIVKTGEDGKITDPNCLLDAMQALKTKYLKGACWLMSRSAAGAIRKLKDQTGAYLWQPGLTADAPNTLFGYPVVLSDDMPAVEVGKQTSSIVFGNFKDAYQIVDRAQLNILRDPFSAKPYVEFYATKRVGGEVINFDALKIVAFAGE